MNFFELLLMTSITIILVEGITDIYILIVNNGHSYWKALMISILKRNSSWVWRYMLVTLALGGRNISLVVS